MENLPELIGNISSNVLATTTRFSKSTIIVAAIVFTIHLCVKLYRRSGHLPAFTYHPNSKINKDSTLYCAVCLYEVAGGERFRKLPKCNHCFHVECIDAWFQSHSTCPLCRSQVAHVRRRQQKHERSVLSHMILSILKNVFSKMGNPIDFEVTFVLQEVQGMYPS